MNIAIFDDVDLERRSKYSYLYDRIDRELTADNWMVIDEFESVREARVVSSCIYQRYGGEIEIKFRKYNEQGYESPTLYLRKY